MKIFLFWVWVNVYSIILMLFCSEMLKCVILGLVMGSMLLLCLFRKKGIIELWLFIMLL